MKKIVRELNELITFSIICIENVYKIKRLTKKENDSLGPIFTKILNEIESSPFLKNNFEHKLL